MPNKTPVYRLETFKRGSVYSAASDFRRFVTLDYNLESYVGVVGVGIIDGWQIDSLTGLTVQILPGEGVISGYFAESPYTIKQRSEMIAGDREVYVIPDVDGIPEPNLTEAQRTAYIQVVRLYNPSFNPTGSIENAYVKIVVPTQIVLTDNTDNYIYAKRPDNALPYPPLNDYPPDPGSPPDRSDYDTYDEYHAAQLIYQAKIDAIHAYNWQSSSGNHFTAVEFVVSTNYINSSSRVLLGRVVTRNSSIIKTDTSMVKSLANLESEITQFATDFLVAHRHGGTKFFDPPKIRLETDIRDCFLLSYDEASRRSVFAVSEKDKTSLEEGHQHTYKVDAYGNGITLSRIGSLPIHYHVISEFSVGNPQGNVETVTDHIHTVQTASQSGDTWDSDSSYIVYVNDVAFGDEDSSNVEADADNQTVTFEGGVSVTYATYSTSFQAFGQTYTYTAKSYSIIKFMLEMILNFWNTFELQLSEAEDRTAVDPFTFYSDAEETQLSGLEDLQNQSEAAQALLTSSGDQFIFTPDAANNITVTMVQAGKIDSVEIEILGNSEVTGTLSADNILFIKAEKIALGEFDVHVIPFISHVGRLRENCLPLQYSLVSNDGARYKAVPSLTDASFSHSHDLLINKSETGATEHTMMGIEPVYYGTDDENSYFIAHSHSVENGVVSSSESSGLLNWYNAVNGTNLSSSSHTHNIIPIIKGDNKIVYSIKEDVNGHLYAGTSNGFMFVPADPSYLFVVNGYEFYLHGNDLWTLLVEAAAQYEIETELPLSVTETVYGSQITDAEEDLVSDGDSVLLEGENVPDRGQDLIMIKKISSFNVPNFSYTEEKSESEVLDTETIIEQDSDGVVVERNFNDIPIWSIELKSAGVPGENYVSPSTFSDIIVVGSNIIAKNRDIDLNVYNSWTTPQFPFMINIARKIIKAAGGDYWLSSSNGIFVSRSYNNGDIFNMVSLPGSTPDIKDVIEGARGSIYCVSDSGIFKTTDGGKTWSKIFDVIGGFQQITRDYTLDKSTTVNGHYHLVSVNVDGNGFLEESIGSGVHHVHVMSQWQVQATLGHTHTLITTLYAIDNSKIIWKSINNGDDWTQYGSIPSGEFGVVISSFGKLYVAMSDGLYGTSNGEDWTKVFNYKVYSYNWDYDMSNILLGINNAIYSTSDGSSYSLVKQFEGLPYPIVIENGTRTHYEYAYSNESKTFHFKNLLVASESDKIGALVDFNVWYAAEGAWDTDSLYDVYVNYRRILSTKFNEDNRISRGYYFSVDPSNGALNFTVSSSLSSAIDIYDLSISVQSSTGFLAGDRILIQSNSSSMYTTIASISGNTLTLSSRSHKAFSSGTVYKIPNLDGDSSILLNIYDSILGNIGTFTHDELEDGLSNFSDGRPYKFNDTYLSNILQLTQAVRYVYPDINSEFVNDVFYDFRYSASVSDPLYPYIGDYIDLLTSDIYNQKVYDSSFEGKSAKSINDILIGFGSFANKIFVATDIGIFWAVMGANFESNWFYIGELQFEVYNLMIFGSDRLMAATINGTYYATDMETWQLESSPALQYPSYSLGLRWSEQDSVIVASHTATFVSDSTTNTGRITASSGTPYKVLSENAGIRVTGAGDKNGGYIIEEIRDGGTGYGSEIIVSPSFEGSDGIKTGVVITMISWWENWNGDVNLSNANITNTLLVGGNSLISYNDGEEWAWYESSFPLGVDNFIVREFLPLSIGSVLSAATGTDSTDIQNYLLRSDDIGRAWSTLKTFDEVRGTITSQETSSDNNTILTVAYVYPENFVYVNGIMDQARISIFSPNNSVALWEGYVIWNERRNSEDIIRVFGNGAGAIIGDKTTYTFKVYPSKVNTMISTANETLMFGTDKGIYYDVDSIIGNVKPTGSILSVGINGVVESIDITGKIISIGTNNVSGNSVLVVDSDIVIRGGEVVGKTLYVTDANPIEEYTIANNGSYDVGGEVAIEITGTMSILNVGARFTIVGDTSRLFVNFDLPVKTNEFNNGTFYVTSNENNNIGKIYSIKSNSSTYVDLDKKIIPSSTFVGAAAGNNGDIQAGQSIRLLDSSGRLTIWVTFSRYIKENSLARLAMNMTTSNNVTRGLISASNLDNVSIYSNTVNSIVIDPFTLSGTTIPYALAFDRGDIFEIIGMLYDYLPSFSFQRTSIESDHYHNVTMEDAIVSGEVGSFGDHDASYVVINVSNTEHFSDEIVQRQGDLFENAEIVFTNDDSYNLRYVSDVISHNSTSVTVRIKSLNNWNFTAYDSLKVSVGWKWEINATNYGYTEGITYDDFAVYSKFITDDLSRGGTTVKVSDVIGMVVGDKISIQDDTLSVEINYIASIVDAQTITISNGADRTYYKNHNPQIKVLRDTFSNTHVHQIRNNEVELLRITSYLDRGYPSAHSHRVLPIIQDVSSLLLNADDVVAAGSGSSLYKSSDNGVSWSEMVDLNNFIEGYEEVDGVSALSINNNKLIAGSTSGSLFVEIDDNSAQIVPLNQP